MCDPVLDALERLIRTDPAQRGLIAAESRFEPLLSGQLSLAARSLAQQATSVAIVTGFYIPSATPPAAETDGPLGAVLLAETLRQLGIPATIITDSLCENVVQAAARSFPYLSQPAQIITAPQTVSSTPYSHLISIERVGPSHTLDSISRQVSTTDAMASTFETVVPAADRDRCFNMRGVCIDEWTVPLHRLFETAARSTPPIRTIGIGDGGNEIGMGAVPWSELARRLPTPPGGKIACRIPCDWTILAGVSNWGGYALAAAVAYLRGRVDILEPWTSTQQADWLETVVRDGPAVDGITKLPQATVDGLPFATYIQPWDAMRQLLGLRR